MKPPGAKVAAASDATASAQAHQTGPTLARGEELNGLPVDPGRPP